MLLFCAVCSLQFNVNGGIVTGFEVKVAVTVKTVVSGRLLVCRLVRLKAFFLFELFINMINQVVRNTVGSSLPKDLPP